MGFMYGASRYTRRRLSVRGRFLVSLFILRDLNDADILCSLDYLFQIAVDMKKLGLPWLSDVKPIA